MPRFVESVVFDFDGTLADSRPGIERCLSEAIAEVAPTEQPVFSAGLIGPPVRDMVRSLLPQATDALVDQAVAVFRRCYDGGGWRDTVPYAGVEPTLTTLQASGRRLFIVTNKPLVPTQRILSALEWDRLFVAVVCRDSRTPSFASKSEALGDLMTRESLDPGATVLVGDSADDATAAASQGMAFVCAAYGYGAATASACAAAAISSPAELIGVVDRTEV